MNFEEKQELLRRGILGTHKESRKISAGAADSDPIQNQRQVEIEALTPAGAILYPERLVKRIPHQDTGSAYETPVISTISFSRYDDIWENEDDLCVYCPAVISPDAARCPRCHRKPTSVKYSEQRTSPNLIIFFVLVLAVAQLFFIQIFLDIIIGSQLITIFWHSLIFSAFILLSILIAIRHPAGYVGSILLLVIVLTLISVEWLASSNAAAFMPSSTLEHSFLSIAQSPLRNVAETIINFIRPFQIITVILAILYGILAVGPDFERRRFKLVARIDKGLSEASDYFIVGKRYSEKGMWASAILHYRMAAANEPRRESFLRSLGLAYAQLGFFERALDVLESAKKVNHDPLFLKSIQDEIDKFRFEEF